MKQAKLQAAAGSRLRLAVLGAVSALALLSCSLLNGGLAFDYEGFQAEYRSWQAAGIRNYAFDYYSSGFTFENVHVEVRDNAVVSSTPLEGSMRASYDKTVDAIYQEIEAFYLAEKDKLHNDSEWYVTGITMAYSAEHAPARVLYQDHVPAGLAVDGNGGFEIRNFVVR